MDKLSHEEMLKRSGLHLKFRRLRSDLFETYKILSDLDRVDVKRMFHLVRESRTRVHCLKIRGCSCQKKKKKRYF